MQVAGCRRVGADVATRVLLLVPVLTCHLMELRLDQGTLEPTVLNQEVNAMIKKTYEICPVGAIRKIEDSTYLEVFEEFTDGLLGMEQFSHLLLLCWFDPIDTVSKRSTLRGHPKNDRTNPLTGVFATRSPRRPNPIAVNISKIIGIHGNKIEIDPVDAFDGTPVIDIKPYIPLSDAIPDATVPSWVMKKREQE